MQDVVRFGLTDMQTALLTGLLDGLEPDAALERAGYGEKKHNFHLNLQSDKFRRALDHCLRLSMQTEGAPLASRFLISVIRSDKYGERTRVDAAKTILDRSGYGKLDSAPGDADSKAPEDMTTDELRSLLSKMQHELGDRAKPIDTRLNASDLQLTDMM